MMMMVMRMLMLAREEKKLHVFFSQGVEVHTCSKKVPLPAKDSLSQH
jgi:hypothetical protein